MKSQNKYPELGVTADFVDAIQSDSPAPESVGMAQQALENAIAERIEKRSWFNLHRPLTWALPTIVVLISAMIMFVGGPAGPKPAFADVQRYFNDFETLYAEMRISVMGSVVSNMNIHLENGGRSRIDMESEVSYVIDPEQGFMVILMHRSSSAQITPLAGGDQGQENEQLEWLDRIREFQGVAGTLPAQQIRGRLAEGYVLNQNGNVITIWADAMDGTPLRMDGNFGGRSDHLMNMSIDFFFNQEIDNKVFDIAIPDGYHLLLPGQDQH